jgi:hypothetical protein
VVVGVMSCNVKFRFLLARVGRFTLARDAKGNKVQGSRCS